MDRNRVPDNLRQLWRQADDLWEVEQDRGPFHSYASANYELVFDSLTQLLGQAATFLEWGSGLGMVSIMASQLGFEAYGIEAEIKLVEHAQGFAEQVAANTQFAIGSFIPDEFEWDPSAGDESIRTSIDAPDAYDQFDLNLQDFDLIYAYPWPTEHKLYHNILKQFARPGAFFLSYDAREGIDLQRV
jgi:hypothetical protein